MLDTTGNEIYPAHKCSTADNFLQLSMGRMTVFGDFNIEIPLNLAISVFTSSLNFMLSRVEYEKV